MQGDRPGSDFASALDRLVAAAFQVTAVTIVGPAHSGMAGVAIAAVTAMAAMAAMPIPAPQDGVRAKAAQLPPLMRSYFSKQTLTR